MRRRANDIISELESGNFYADCPCGDTFSLKDANLFYSNDFNIPAKIAYGQYQSDIKERRKALIELKKKIESKSEVGAKSVNVGLILERIAPSLREFPFNCNDCRSLFDPIDYLVFEGLEKTGKVTKIFWIDIKTGQARLKAKQREIRKLIEDKKLEWGTYQVEKNNE